MAPLLLIVVLVIGYTASRSLRNGGRAGTDDLKAQVEALKKQIGSSPDVSASGSAEESPDVAAAKREMERLRSQYGLVPPTDASGNVHLQGGGTVTREQYQRALDSLNRSSGGR